MNIRISIVDSITYVLYGTAAVEYISVGMAHSTLNGHM